jgi:DNA-binding GntR family transcriptional regulator
MLLRDSIYQAIRGAILTCELQPGQELREQVLAERYRVSRSPIRDSLLRLEQENLITVLPRQGYRVNPISASDVEDIFGLRLLIEPACAAAAAGAEDEALRALDQFRGFSTHEQAEAKFYEYNKSFHHAITVLSGNIRMAAIALDLDEQSQRLVQATMHAVDYEQICIACRQHEDMIDALQAHDAVLASRLAYEHLTYARGGIEKAMRLVGQRWEEPAKAEPMPVGG